MRRIAITGGIAEGKSTVLAYLSELGYEVESADRVAREVLEAEEVQTQIASLTGGSLPVDRTALRRALSDDRLRRALNAIMHPAIIERLASVKAPFIEVPLLIETCLQGAFDRTWVVTCGQDEQRRRLVARLGDEASATAILATQLPSRTKMPFADCVIRTNREQFSVKRFVTVAAQREMC